MTTSDDQLIERHFRPDDAAFIADPYPDFAALREAMPIGRDPRSGQWLLTRFDDVHAALRDRRLGREFTQLFDHAEFGRPEPDPRWARFHEHESWSLLALEPPDHTRLRRLVSKVFTQRSVNALRPTIERRADEILDRCAELGTIDLIADYAQPYSVGVICAMLGVPDSDTQRLLDWSHAIVKMYELHATDAQRVAADDAAGEFIEYVHALIERKRADPDDLLLSELVRVEDDDDTLTVPEITSTTMVLLEAGHEATVNTLGNGMRAMTRHPDQWRRVTSGEVDAAVAVEEMLRWDSPTQLFDRFVLADDVTIAGQQLERGDEVAMLFGSAQRDPDRFEDPDRFDVARGDTKHIGFGGGIHFCIGAPLARAEVAVSVAAIARRFPDLELVEEPTYHPTFVIRGLESLRLNLAD